MSDQGGYRAARAAKKDLKYAVPPSMTDPVHCLKAEMEKRADAADASVLFFSLAVLICWLYTRKLAKKELCYLQCAISTMR